MAEYKNIQIRTPGADYPVLVGSGLLDQVETWTGHLGSGRLLVVSNEVVAPLYLDRLQQALEGREYETLVLPDGEQHKTMQTWSSILDRLIETGCRRDACIVALGGGVVGDISGYAAASYMRGIRFLQIPTTLLAQVDASVGGKTGFNHVRGKNLVGAFHQPSAVVIDTATLDTLEDREYRAGIAEVVKYGAIMDAAFFDWLEQQADAITNRDSGVLSEMIARCVQCKADIVAQDEKEAGVRALLNFGHSFGHALESETAYTRFLHGEAVAMGMVVAARLSEQRGLCPDGASERIAALLERFGLPVNIPSDIPAARLLDALSLDKKALATGLRLILLRSVGDAVIDTGSTSNDILLAISEGTS